MRILCAIGGMFGGGSERQMLQLVQNLDRARYQPELYLVAEGGEFFDQIPTDVPVHIFHRRVRAGRDWLPGAGFRKRVADVAAVLRERQIEQIYDRTYHMSLITAGGARIVRVPRISTIVSDPQSDFATNVERFRWFKRRLLHRAYTEAEVTAAVSVGVKQAAAAFHQVPADRIEVFSNLYDIDAIRRRSAEPVPAGWERKPGVLRIATAGRLHRAKAHDVLIDAFARLTAEGNLPPTELVIVGNGPEETALRQQIAAAGIEDRVLLTGFLENPLPIVATADLFCLSSRYEGLPNALLEALICGVPVVATDCPHGPREVLDEGRWGALVPMEAPAALAAALGGGLRHLAPFRQRAVAAQKVISERYSQVRGLARFDELVALAQRRFAGSRS